MKYKVMSSGTALSKVGFWPSVCDALWGSAVLFLLTRVRRWKGLLSLLPTQICLSHPYPVAPLSIHVSSNLSTTALFQACGC